MGRARALGVVGLARALALSDSLGPSGRRAGPIRRSASATRRAAGASRSATGGRRTRRSSSSPSKAGRSRSRSCARAAHRTPQTSYDGTISASSSRPRRNAMFIGPTETRSRAPSSGASVLCIRRVRARSLPLYCPVAPPACFAPGSLSSFRTPSPLLYHIPPPRSLPLAGALRRHGARAPPGRIARTRVGSRFERARHGDPRGAPRC